MTRKFDSARKKAFLAALRVSGNQTLSAERAKVSRSWVTLRRSKEPQFDAACREAIREARERARFTLRQAQASGRADAGRERGRPQIARARVRQWSPWTE